VFDVVIAGGGPAGSVCAATLAQKGLQVLVLEKTKFPRFHLGESLLPNSLPVLEAIGALPEIESRFIWKHGARFHEDHGPKRRKDRFDFANA
jgi:2-polyprenyl-6-methoxyphenol hydroxylase-like FAD-dependent oxidoreductase